MNGMNLYIVTGTTKGLGKALAERHRRARPRTS